MEALRIHTQPITQVLYILKYIPSEYIKWLLDLYLLWKEGLYSYLKNSIYNMKNGKKINKK